MNTWDIDLLLRINRDWAHPALDWLMPAVSAINAWVPLLIPLVLYLLWRGRKETRIMLLCIGLAVGIGDGVVSNTLKKTIGRVRPRDAITGVIVRDLGPGSPAIVRLFKAPVQSPSQPRGETRGKSFPSSHTVNMFAVAICVALFHRGWGGVAFCLATLIAYSRIYVGAHWPGDIPPSIGLGLLVGYAVVTVVRRVASRR